MGKPRHVDCTVDAKQMFVQSYILTIVTAAFNIAIPLVVRIIALIRTGCD